MVEILNEALHQCKIVKGSIAPIAGWTDATISVEDSSVLLPDLEV